MLPNALLPGATDQPDRDGLKWLATTHDKAVIVLWDDGVVTHAFSRIRYGGYMAAVKPQLTVLDKLKSDQEIAEIGHVNGVTLSPSLVLAASLLYMMSSDGSIEDEESSRLQAALDGHGELLNFALHYVQLVSVDQFLEKAPEVLSTQDKLCILSNVCDSMLSDGHSDPAELALFARLLAAFEISEAAFGPYFKTITLKNDKANLGPYQPVGADTDRVTPHLALAASLLYMMSADGAIGTQEIGQLEAVIGEFDGLQQTALTYVRQVKRGDFLKAVGPVLSDQQKLCILINVCDSMLSDGSVAALEDKLFVTMLDAFGYSESAFQTYYQVIETKNVKPFDTRKFKAKTAHSRLTGGGNEDGEIFENKFSDEAQQRLSDDAGEGAANQDAWTQGANEKVMGSIIHRTMQENISSVNQDFGNQENIAKVSDNATYQLNVQKVSQDAGGENLQTIEPSPDGANRQSVTSASGVGKNVQTIAGDVSAENRQAIAAEDVAANVQQLPGDGASNNNQAVVATEPLGDQSEFLSPEVRVKNLFEDIDTLNRKLDDIEKKNKKILEAARQARLEMQRQEAAALQESINRQALDVAATAVNLQPVDTDVLGVNVQEVAIEKVSDNYQPVDGSTQTSRLPLGQSALGVNRAPVVNQPIGANRALVAKHAISANNPLDASPALDATNAEALYPHAVTAPQDLPQDADAVLTLNPDDAPPVAGASKAQSLRHRRGLKNRRRALEAQGDVVPWRVDWRAGMAFVVLSCWASSIAATDGVLTQRFAGKLERAPVVWAEEALEKTTE